MLKPSSLNPLLAFEPSMLFRTNLCLSCRLRGAAHLWSRQSTPIRRLASSNAKQQSPEVKKKKIAQSEEIQTPERQGKSETEEFIPLQLDRPLGLTYPPRPGQNTGIDSRSLGERRDDFVNYEKHITRRRELTRQIAKPYFREWSNLKYHEGKTFISNPRLFKRDKALYFPNMYGITLSSPKTPQDTTSILKGRISVVNLFSSVWAESQVATFTGQEQNPRLHDALRSGHKHGDYVAQKVDINLEENAMKAWLVRMFMWRMRQNLPDAQHPRYFLVRKGLIEELKQAIGMLNSKVGYVYLLDDECRIRWAGSGPAEGMEKEALNHGLRRLIEEKINARQNIGQQNSPTK